MYTTFDGDRILTFFYDDQYDSRIGYPLEDYVPGNTHFKTCNTQVKKIVIDESMKNAPLEKIDCMFYGGYESGTSYALKNATEIVGLNYLNTASVTSASEAFYGLASITELDLTSFDMSNVTTAISMFCGCTSLKAIYCTQDWSSLPKLEYSGEMFLNCTSLKGGKGTTYSSSYQDRTYARPEYKGGAANGYFSYPKWDGNLSNVTADVWAEDGMVISGTYYLGTVGPDPAIYILPGVHVTLDHIYLGNGSIHGFNTHGSLHCLGDAHLTLKGSNSIYAFNYYYPCIFVPEGSTLTIDADAAGGSLTATGTTSLTAAIGGGQNVSCGNIHLKSGEFTLAGGNGAAALGGGKNAKCGDITIDKPVKGTFTRSDTETVCTIGKGGGSSAACGKVSIAGEAYAGGITVNPFTLDGKFVYTHYDSEGTLTYYFDDLSNTRTGEVEEYDPETVRFKAYNQLVKKVVIDVSMKKAELTTMKRLFYGYRDTGDSYSLENATAIEGLANLNTAAVTSMEQMFYGMDKIDTIDLSSFNTSNVTSMREMFGLCWALKSLNLTSFNTANVLSMRAMFQGCLALPALDLTSFSVDKVTSMVNMFYDCEALKSIYCDGNWSTSTASSDAMFYGCTQLEGGRGTKYNSSKDDNEYARPDKGSQAGYFTGVAELISGDKGLLTWDKETLTKIRTFANNSMGVGGQPLVKYIDDAMPAIDAALANTGTTYAVAQAIEAARKTADGNVGDAQDQFVALVIAGAKAIIDGEIKADDSEACKKIAADAKAEVEKSLKWNGAESVDDNLSGLWDASFDLADKAKNAIIGQRIVEKKVVLKGIIDEMTALYDVADTFLEAKDKGMLKPLSEAIEAADKTYNKSDATMDMVTDAITAAQSALNTAIETFLTKAKEEICASFDEMLEEGDSKACEQLVADAKAAINAIEWDSSKSVDENYKNIYGTGYSVTKKLSDDLEAQRKEDNKAPVCDFTTKATSHGKYSDSWVYDGKWTVFGGSNNNGNWNYVKMGGNKDNIATANPVYVANKDAFTKEIKGIKVSYPDGSFPTASKMGVNEWGVKVYKTPECKEADLLYTVKGDAAAITNKAATLILRPEAGQTWAAGCGFQVYWDIINTSTTNGTVFVETIEFSYEDIPLGMDNVQSDNVQNAKILRNGQLFILRDGKMYTISGAEVR